MNAVNRELRVAFPRWAIAAAVAWSALAGSRPACAQATWTSAISGTWGNTANWSTGVVPGAGNNTAAVLSNTSASYTVTYDTAMTGTLAGFILKNTVGGTTTLNINAPGFAIAGSGTTPGAGAEMAFATINLNSGGVFTNTGKLAASGSSSSVIVNGGMLVNTSDFGYAAGLLDTIKINLTLSSGTVSSTGSGFFFPALTMTGGALNVTGSSQPGLNASTISGGTFTNTSVSGINNRGAITVTGSAYVSTTGLSHIGNGNNIVISGGTVLITGTQFYVGSNNFTSTRTGDITQSGGSVSMANAAGLVVGFASGTISAASDYSYRLSGGTLSLEKITLAASGYTGSGTNRFTMSGGTLTLGSGGIVIGSGSGVKAVQLSGGTIRAAADWSSSVNMSLLTSAGTGTATFQAADAGNVARNITLSGILSGSGALAKTGGGVLVLQNANTYLGATAVRAGRLQIDAAGTINSTSGITIDGAGAELKYNSATPLTRAITFTQGTISGTGTIGTAVTVGASNILSPGNSPGIQAYTSGLTWAPGGQYTWEINGWSGSAGTNYDQVVVSGSALNITATSGNTFKIAVTGLTAGNASGAVPGFSAAATTGTSFVIATSSAGITGFDNSKFTIDTSGFTASNTLPTNAGFWLSTSSTSVDLNYAPSATYNLSAAATATSIRVGGSSTITASILSSTASLTNPDTLAYGGLALSGGVGTLSSTSGTLAPGVSSGGNAVFTGTAAGGFSFTPLVTSGTNVNIGTAANPGSTLGVTVSVYNLATASTLSSPIALGTVLKGTSLSQSLSITNTAPNGGYSERLDAAFGSLAGAATTNSGSISLLGPQSSSTAMVVGLSTATAGTVSGSVQVNFASNGEGTSGLGTLALSPQTVSLTATVLDRAVASFTSGSTATTSLLLDFGSVNQNASVAPLAFDLYNLVQTSGFTADLALIGIVSGTGNTGAFSTTLSSTFTNLTADGAPYAYTASFDTSAPGIFVNTYTYSFKSANGGTVYGSDTVQTLSLTVQGIIVVPEPGTAAAAGLGIVIMGWSAWKRRRHARV